MDTLPNNLFDQAGTLVLAVLILWRVDRRLESLSMQIERLIDAIRADSQVKH